MASSNHLTIAGNTSEPQSPRSSQSPHLTSRLNVLGESNNSLSPHATRHNSSRRRHRSTNAGPTIELPDIEPDHRRSALTSQGSRSSIQEDSYRDDEVGDALGGSTRSPDDEEVDDGASIRTQGTRLERRDLNGFDVAALIINKMIGTGIFTTPGLVLSLTGNKKFSIVMWLCGGIWSFLSILIYVEFGVAFPFNGGELVYLDEVLRRPDLYATVLFAAFFILIPNTGGNSLQFSKHVLLAANPAVENTEDLDRRLITLIAILVLSVVCLLHYFSRNSGLLLNLVFAAYKILLVVVLIIAGGISYHNSTNRPNDWNDQPVARRDALAALIYIVYSYQGWENANYVGGELRIARSDLKWGAFMAVGLVTILYTLVTMAIALACPFPELVGQDLGIVTHFVPLVFGGHSQGMKICIALSAFGNLVAVVYTSSKVKQQIARQCVIPFSKFFGGEDTRFETPMGALILHWVFGAIWIITTPNTPDGYGFIIGIFIYGQAFVGACLGFAYCFIRRTYEGPESRQTAGIPKTWTPVILTNKWLGYSAAILFIGFNVLIMVESARAPGSPSRWYWPVILFSVLGAASTYWAVLRIIARVSDNESPLEIRILKNVSGGNTGTAEDQPALKQAKLEGNNRIVVYELHGKAKSFRDWIDVWGYKTYKLIAR